MPITGLATLADAAALAALELANRSFLTPWSPQRDDAYFTEAGQRAVIEDALARHRDGTTFPHLVLADGDRVVGRINLNGIVGGPFLSCSVGYWVSFADNGRGLATAALTDMKRVAFEALGLHRVQAETLVHNIASQQVLLRNGFVKFGVAPAYLKIAGRWQDHAMCQVVNSTPM